MVPFGRVLGVMFSILFSLVPKWECETLTNQVKYIKRFGINSDVIVSKKC